MSRQYSEAQRASVRSAIDDSLRQFAATRPAKRHPAEVTADRLGDALDKWPEAFGGEARDAVGLIRHILSEIAETT